MEIKNINSQISRLEKELDLWGCAIGCIGRDPYNLDTYCTLSRGGAINELGFKEYFKIPSRYDARGAKEYEYHVNPSRLPKNSKKLECQISPNPDLARTFIEKAINYVEQTKDLEIIPEFEIKRSKVLERFENSNKNITVPYAPNIDYTPIQNHLSQTVQIIANIEEDYKCEINHLRNQRNKKIAINVGKTAAVIAIATAIGWKIPKLKNLKILGQIKQLF